MLRLHDGQLIWMPHDDAAMLQVLGDVPAKRAVPFNHSVILDAQRRGVQIMGTLQASLKAAIAHRRQLRVVKAMPDHSLPPKLYHRADDLFAHQRVGLVVASASGFNSMLIADEPGVGKTALAIELMLNRTGGRDTLVVTTNAAKEQWRRAIQSWTPAAQITIVDGKLNEQALQVEESHGWVVMHWEALVNVGAIVTGRLWNGVVLDEATHMKNRKSERARAAHLLSAPHRLVLTGHPYVNDPSELWSLLHFLFPERYPSFWRFFFQHVRSRPRHFGGYDVFGAKHPKLLAWEIEPFTLRRTKRQVFPSLPRITRVVREVELPSKHRAEYEKLRRQLFTELAALPDGTRNVLMIPSVLAKITRWRQHLVDPGLLKSGLPSLKYPLVQELLEEIGAPTIVFTSFRQAALRLGAFLRRDGFAVGYVFGKKGARVEAPTGAHAIQLFHHDKLDALIVVTQAGGEALNLGGFGYLMFLDVPWSAKAIEQAEARVDRPAEGTGKLVPTTAYYLLTRRTYEDTLVGKAVHKGEDFRSVFAGPSLLELLRA